MVEAEMASHPSIYKQSTTENLPSLNKEESLLAISYCVLNSDRLYESIYNERIFFSSFLTRITAAIQ